LYRAAWVFALSERLSTAKAKLAAITHDQSQSGGLPCAVLQLILDSRLIFSFSLCVRIFLFLSLFVSLSLSFSLSLSLCTKDHDDVASDRIVSWLLHEISYLRQTQMIAAREAAYFGVTSLSEESGEDGLVCHPLQSGPIASETEPCKGVWTVDSKRRPSEYRDGAMPSRREL